MWRIILVFFLVCWTNTAFSQLPNESDKPVTETEVFNPESDTRLAKPITLRVKSVAIKELLESVAQALEVPLKVTEDIADRRISLFAEKQQLAEVLRIVAQVHRFSWRQIRTDSNGTAYELYQTKSQLRQERMEIAASEQREEVYRRSLTDTLMRKIGESTASRQSGTPSFGNLLSAFSPEQIRRAAAASMEPTGVIAADNQSHFYNRFLFSTPFSQLPADAQNTLLQWQKEASLPVSDGDMLQSYVGIVAADGGVRLGIFGPNSSDLWVSGHYEVQGAMWNPIEDLNDFDAAVKKMLGNPRLVDLETLPDTLAEKRLKFPSDLDRTQLSAVLESIAAQTGLTLAAHDYLRTRDTPYAHLLTDKEEYTLVEALTQIARTFGHQITYRGKGLLVQTLTPGLDLRSEPPAPIVAYLKKLTEEKRAARLSDYLQISHLSTRQLNTLISHRVKGLSVTPLLLKVQRLRPILNLFALLTPDQRQLALSETGYFIAVNSPVYPLYREMTEVGLPDTSRLQPQRFYVRQAGVEGKPEIYQFTLTSEKSPPTATRFSLVFP